MRPEADDRLDLEHLSGVQRLYRAGSLHENLQLVRGVTNPYASINDTKPPTFAYFATQNKFPDYNTKAEILQDLGTFCIDGLNATVGDNVEDF